MSKSVSVAQLAPGDVFAMPPGSLGAANALRYVSAPVETNGTAADGGPRYVKVHHYGLGGTHDTPASSNFLAGIEVEVYERVELDDGSDDTPLTTLGFLIDHQLEDCEDGAYIRVYRDAGGTAVWL